MIQLILLVFVLVFIIGKCLKSAKQVLVYLIPSFY